MHSSPSDPSWLLDGHQGLWNSSSTQGQLNLKRPHRGICLQLGQNCPLPGAVLQVNVKLRHESNRDGNTEESWDWDLLRTYLRGKRLTANYVHSRIPQEKLQIDWRVTHEIDDEVLLKIDVVISCHTESIQSHLDVFIKTELACEQLVYMDSGGKDAQPVPVSGVGEERTNRPGCAIFQRSDLPWSYLEMVYPSDFNCWRGGMAENAATDNRMQNTRWGLECQMLEKGVIRRLQLRGLLVPKEYDFSLANKYLNSYAEDKLPLT